MVTNACGSNSITQTISIVGQAPDASFTAESTTGCLPFTVNFTDESSGEPTAWSWSFPGGSPTTSTEQNQTVIYDNAGTYEVSLTVTNDFGESTDVQAGFITVGDVPTADFDYSAMDDGVVDFINNSTDADTYSWDFGDGNSSDEENPSHTYAESGTYTVILTATNDCGSTDIEIIVDIMITDVEEIESIEVFNLYPNPNNGQFILILEGQSVENLQLNLFNVLGQNLFAETLDYQGGRWSRTYNFDYLASGTYLLQLRSEGKVLYRKVIIE